MDKEQWLDGLRRWQEAAPEETLIRAVRHNEWSNNGVVKMVLFPGHLAGWVRVRGREIQASFAPDQGGQLVAYCSACGPRAQCIHAAGLAEWALKVRLAPAALSDWPFISA